MKVNDFIKLECGVGRILSCSSTLCKGLETWSATVLCDGYKTFVWGHFRLCCGVWCRYDPFSA